MERHSLENINIEFPKGETTLIMGTSGAGKSTLIKCITGKRKYMGVISDGKKIDMAYIPQHPALNIFETAFESVYWSARFENLLAPNKKLLEMTEEYVNKVGLSYVKNNPIKKLSGGQKQRVAIARELIRRKKILIADEIDTGLDVGVANALISMLSDITKEEEKTTIVISHNLMNLDLYDNVIVLVKDSNKVGRIAYSGKTEYVREFFEVDDLIDILKKVNSLDEAGEGLADYYIEKYEKREGSYCV